MIWNAFVILDILTSKVKSAKAKMAVILLYLGVPAYLLYFIENDLKWIPGLIWLFWLVISLAVGWEEREVSVCSQEFKEKQP